MIDGRNFLVNFNLERNEFLDSQVNLHSEINDSVLGLKLGPFGDLGLFLGFSYTSVNQLRMVKSSALLFQPYQGSIGTGPALTLPVSSLAAVEHFQFNEKYLFYSYFEESLITRPGSYLIQNL